MLRRRMNGSARSAFCASGHSISRDHGTLVYRHAHAGAASRPLSMNSGAPFSPRRSSWSSLENPLLVTSFGKDKLRKGTPIPTRDLEEGFCCFVVLLAGGVATTDIPNHNGVLVRGFVVPES